MSMLQKFFLLSTGFLFVQQCSPPASFNREAETAHVTKAIHDSIGWAKTKDTELLFRSVAQDAEFLILNPDSSEVRGFDAFKSMVEQVFMNDAFKAVRYEVKNLTITFSKSGDVAWFASTLDDFNEWNGQSSSWENVRWTGVLEKRNGTWVLCQMHFSFPQRSESEESA